MCLTVTGEMYQQLYLAFTELTFVE